MLVGGCYFVCLGLYFGLLICVCFTVVNCLLLICVGFYCVLSAVMLLPDCLVGELICLDCDLMLLIVSVLLCDLCFVLFYYWVL